MESEIPLKGWASNGEERKNSNSRLKESFTKRLRRYFRNYCNSSSITGFGYLGERRSRGERILWALLIVVATILSIHYIMEIYDKYKENPFVVTLATRELPIYTLPFPAVTICPVAKAMKKYFNFTGIVYKIWNKEILTDEEKLNAQYMSILCNLEDDEYKAFFNPNKTFDAEGYFDTLSSLKPKREEVFFVCKFLGDYIDCNDLFINTITDEGICYTFNILNRNDIFRPGVQHYSKFHLTNETSWSVEGGYPGTASKDDYPRRALLAGADNSLEILLTQNVQDTDYLCMSEVLGYSIQIHTPYSIPLMKKQFFSVPLDSYTQAMVTPNLVTTSSEVKTYKLEDRQCYFSDERHLRFFKIYSPENCKMECLSNYTMQKCGCVHFYLPRDSTMSICGNGNVDCMINAERLQKEEELDRVLLGTVESDVDAGCNCLPLCTELSFKTETSRSDWYWKNQFAAERISERFGLANFSENVHFSRLLVFFKSDHFIPSERNELYGFFDFLSNFGGLLGLFTGFSLLSAIEIVYFISVRLWCNKKIYNDCAGPAPEKD